MFGVVTDLHSKYPHKEKMNIAALFPIFVTLTSHVSFAVQLLESTPSFLKDTIIESSTSYLEPPLSLGIPDSLLPTRHLGASGEHSGNHHMYSSENVAPGLNLLNEGAIKHFSTSTNNKSKYVKRKRRWSNFTSWGKRGSDTSDGNNQQSSSKRWGNSALWGKRWGNSALWGKRWGNSALWGKRDYDTLMKYFHSAKDGGDKVNTLDEPQDKKWKQVAAWGKRSADQQRRYEQAKMNQILVNDLENEIKSTLLPHADLQSPYKQLNHDQWRPEQNEPDKFVEKWKQYLLGEQGAGESSNKRWDQTGVWGKRYDGDVDSEPMDKRWKQQSLWGKRDLIEQLNKKWRQMSLWGKRGYTIGDYNPHGLLNKRWKGSALWGKRSDSIPDKKWSQMSVWGKRSDVDTDDAYDWINSDEGEKIDKRWKDTALWGKRDPEDAEAFQNFDKKWVDRSKSGQRTFRTLRNWRDIKMWGRKRPSWSRTGFTSWGKRSTGGNDDLLPHNLFGSQTSSIGDQGQSLNGGTALDKGTQP